MMQLSARASSRTTQIVCTRILFIFVFLLIRFCIVMVVMQYIFIHFYISFHSIYYIAPADYCKLFCQAANYSTLMSKEYLFAEKVEDGTKCERDSHDICVNGECLVSRSACLAASLCLCQPVSPLLCLPVHLSPLSVHLSPCLSAHKHMPVRAM